tara:strand:+ start:300 stop:1097 length:798 start_codon:yes stop_codon:yes gene_type:complete
MKNKDIYDWSLVSGGFDPLHSGHIKLFEEAKEISKKLCVILNSDNWLISKKGRHFMDQKERALILENLSIVDEIILQRNDEDGSSKNGLKKFRKKYTKEKVCFCNGGDRNNHEQILETNICNELNIDLCFEIGGKNKLNSSSVLLDNYSSKNCERPWGYFNVLSEGKNYKIKKIVIKDGQSLSEQIHKKRSEKWIIIIGSGIMYLDKERFMVSEGDFINIDKNKIHSIYNNGNQDLVILELQSGKYLGEDDIIRIRDKYGRAKKI